MSIVPGFSIILPTVWVLGTETETVADALEHISLEIDISYLQEKTIQIVATEVVVAGAPGNLWIWVELSPYLTPTSAAYWAAIGGGGGALAPVAPLIEVGTGVNLTIHSIIIPWAIYSPFARLVVQTPVPGAAAFWLVQAIASGKGT